MIVQFYLYPTVRSNSMYVQTELYLYRNHQAYCNVFIFINKQVKHTITTRRWHVTISCQPDGRPPQPVRSWKSGRVHLAVRWKKYDHIAVFILYRNVTDGRTDRFAISISRVSMLTRDKNSLVRRIHVSKPTVHIIGLIISLYWNQVDKPQLATMTHTQAHRERG